MPRIPLTNIHIGPHQGYGHEHSHCVQPKQPYYTTGYGRPVYQPVHYGRGHMMANDLKGAGYQVENAARDAFGRRVYY